ncbi:MAG: hypothetical protein ACTHWH_05960 [Marinobacter sp.]
MAFQFVCVDPSARTIYLVEQGEFLCANYSEALADAKIADCLPDHLISAICHTLHQDSLKKHHAISG